MAPKPEARDKLSAIGIDALCEKVGAKMSLTAVAEWAEVSFGSLQTWLESDPERSARMKDARRQMGLYWDERAEDEIRLATDDFELKKAREIASHYRWRASKINVKDYGDKIQQELSGPDGGAIELTTLTQVALDDRIKALVLRLGIDSKQLTPEGKRAYTLTKENHENDNQISQSNQASRKTDGSEARAGTHARPGT